MAAVSEATSQTRRGWGSELSKEQITREFSAEQLAAIDELMDRIRARGLAFQDIGQSDFSHPALDGLLAEVRREVEQGSGVVVLRRFPVDKYSLEDIEKIYWGVGTHFGRACSQSASGDLLGHVTNRGNSRGYNNTRRLGMHVDSAEFVGLLCIRPAKEGGENTLANALKMHEVIKRERPDLLGILERGFRYHRRGEEAEGDEPITPYRVPVFSFEQGVLSCRYTRERIDLAARDLECPLTPLEQEAIDFFEMLAFRDDVRFDLTLKPGEALLTSNFEMLHSRTAFLDWDDPAEKRLVLRLWLEGDPPRPLKREIFTYQNRSGRQGIDPQPGRQAGRPEFMPSDAKLVDG